MYAHSLLLGVGGHHCSHEASHCREWQFADCHCGLLSGSIITSMWIQVVVPCLVSFILFLMLWNIRIVADNVWLKSWGVIIVLNLEPYSLEQQKPPSLFDTEFCFIRIKIPLFLHQYRLFTLWLISLWCVTNNFRIIFNLSPWIALVGGTHCRLTLFRFRTSYYQRDYIVTISVRLQNQLLHKNKNNSTNINSNNCYPLSLPLGPSIYITRC